MKNIKNFCPRTMNGERKKMSPLDGTWLVKEIK